LPAAAPAPVADQASAAAEPVRAAPAIPAATEAAAPLHAATAQPDVHPAPQQRPSLNARLAGIAFSARWWLAAAAALVVSVVVLNGTNHDANPAPYYFAAAPMVSAALAATGVRMGLGLTARLLVVWPSLIAGLLTTAVIEVTLMHGESERPANVVFVPVFFFVAAAACVFVLAAGVALLIHANSAARRRPTGQPASETGAHPRR
jgi:hypothetical protein